MKGVSMVSPINQSKKSKNYSVDGFKWKVRAIDLLYIIFNLVVLSFYFYLILSRDVVRWSLILMAISSLFIYYEGYRRIYIDFYYVVLENMDLKLAKKSLDYISPKYLRKFYKRGIYYNINLLRINFLLGDFKAAYAYISTVNKKRYRIDLNFGWLTDYLFYDYLTRVHSGDNPNVSEYIEMLSSIKLDNKTKKLYIKRHIGFMKAINQIMVEKQPVDNMGELLVANNLDRLMFNYYAALNCLNQNQHEEAKACFREIVNENPDLFYVREAKKYLGEAV